MCSLEAQLLRAARGAAECIALIHGVTCHGITLNCSWAAEQGRRLNFGGNKNEAT
jgi:lipoate-protein ligase B